MLLKFKHPPFFFYLEFLEVPFLYLILIFFFFNLFWPLANDVRLQRNDWSGERVVVYFSMHAHLTYLPRSISAILGRQVRCRAFAGHASKYPVDHYTIIIWKDIKIITKISPWTTEYFCKLFFFLFRFQLWFLIFYPWWFLST